MSARRWTSSAGGEHGFKEGAIPKLEHKSVNQLWRNALLAIAYRSMNGFDRGHLAVLGRPDDAHIAAAVKRLSMQHSAPRDSSQRSSLTRGKRSV